MININIKTCPICNCSMVLKYSYPKSSYMCPTQNTNKFEDGFEKTVSHYFIDFLLNDDIIQTVYYDNFYIYSNVTRGFSQIYKIKDRNHGLIKEVPLILLEEYTKLKKKIEIFIMFS